jgi:hypothetical protein
MKSNVNLFFKILIIFSIYTIISYSLCSTHNISDPKTRRERFCSSDLKSYLIISVFILVIMIFVIKI